MAAYVGRRLVAIAFLAFAMSILVFLIIHLVPGDPAVALLGASAVSTDLVARLHHELGLDLPLPVQYARWIGGVLHGDFGYSYASNSPTSTLVAENLPYTLALTVSSLALSLLVGTVLGVAAALKRNTIVDTALMGFALVILSMPNFWLGLLLISLFSVTVHWFPVFGGTSLIGLVLPTFALGIGSAGFFARFIRSSVLDALHQTHVTTARSKGLRRSRVLARHVLRNAVLPILTLIGLQFGNLISGTVVIETVFSRPGIGRLLVTSILAKDYLTVQSIVLILAMIYAFTNFAIDLLYPVLDPRIVHS